MSSFNDRIDELLKLNKKTKVELSQYAGISKQSFHDWKKRGTIPAADIALKIAEFLNTTVEYLVKGVNTNPLADENQKLYEAIKSSAEIANNQLKL